MKVSLWTFETDVWTDVDSGSASFQVLVGEKNISGLAKSCLWLDLCLMLDALAESFSNGSIFISLRLSPGEFPSQLSPARYLCVFALGLLSFFLNRRGPCILNALARCLCTWSACISCHMSRAWCLSWMPKWLSMGKEMHVFSCVFNIFQHDCPAGCCEHFQMCVLSSHVSAKCLSPGWLLCWMSWPDHSALSLLFFSFFGPWYLLQGALASHFVIRVLFLPYCMLGSIWLVDALVNHFAIVFTIVIHIDCDTWSTFLLGVYAGLICPNKQ